MNSTELKELYDRKTSAMTHRPAFARAVSQTRIHMGEGLACDFRYDDQMGKVDQPESEGGTATGPHPGHLMRASLGACLAMGYRLWGARLGTRIDAVEVEIACEYDARGQLGAAPDIAVGWQRISFDVVVVSTAAKDDVRRVVATADRLCPMLANLSSSVERSHRLTIVAPHEDAGGAGRPVERHVP
jgi:uncharacterized OsmC-like protein